MSLAERPTWLRPKHARTWHLVVGSHAAAGRLIPTLACNLHLRSPQRWHDPVPWETWRCLDEHARPPSRWRTCEACIAAAEVRP